MGGAGTAPETGEGGTGILPALPPSEWHKPGSGGDLAPPQAPLVRGGDGASYSDRRLAGAWAAQEYFGPKPGAQVGSRTLDDARDWRLPLPSAPGAGSGGIGGPPLCELPPLIPPMPLPGLRIPDPRARLGPPPQLSNPDSGGDEASGNAKLRPAREEEQTDPGDETNKTRQKQGEDTGAEEGNAEEETVDERRRRRKRGREAAQRAMDAQQGWFVESSNPDEGSPTGSQGHALADQAFLFGGIIYDTADNVARGAIRRTADKLPRPVVETLGAITLFNDTVGSLSILGGAKRGLKAAANALEEPLSPMARMSTMWLTAGRLPLATSEPIASLQLARR